MNKNNFIEQSGINAVKYDLYFKFEQEYIKIVNAYHNAFAEAQSDPEKSQNWQETYLHYSEQMNVALEHWKIYGYKREIELAFSTHKCYPLTMNNLIPLPALAS